MTVFGSSRGISVTSNRSSWRRVLLLLLLATPISLGSSGVESAASLSTSAVAESVRGATQGDLMPVNDGAESLEESSDTLLDEAPLTDKTFLRTATITRELKHKQAQQEIHDAREIFDAPVEDWSAKQWMVAAVLLVVGLVIICCLLQIVGCLSNCVYSILCCGGNGGRYRNSYEPINRPPAYNPAYQNGGVYTRSAPIGYRRTDCTLWDLLCGLCCLECCMDQRGGGGLGDLCCGLCFFEICCRGGRDVRGDGGGGYGTIVV